MLVWITAGIAIVACGFSLFFGMKACEIFSVKEPEKKSQRFHLFWFNFFGSLVGWLALWVILFKILRCISGSCQPSVELGDLVLALVAFAGITGHLPMATMGIFIGLANIAKNFFKNRWG